jgi:thiol-disulfide isomerase/thioredoxin
MKARRPAVQRALVSATLAGLFCWAAAASRASEAAPLRTVALPDLDNAVHWVLPGDADDIVVLFFIAPECPVSNRTLPVMRRLEEEFGSTRIHFLGVYPERDLPAAALARHAEAFEIRFALRIDREHALVKATGVTRTPEVVIANGAGVVFYRGRIDDRFVDFGKERPHPTREDAREVLAALRRGERPAFRTAAGFGCLINRPSSAP